MQIIKNTTKLYVWIINLCVYKNCHSVSAFKQERREIWFLPSECSFSTEKQTSARHLRMEKKTFFCCCYEARVRERWWKMFFIYTRIYTLGVQIILQYKFIHLHIYTISWSQKSFSLTLSAIFLITFILTTYLFLIRN